VIPRYLVLQLVALAMDSRGPGQEAELNATRRVPSFSGPFTYLVDNFLGCFAIARCSLPLQLE